MGEIHKTIPILVWADIDEGIAPLVQTLNAIPGVRTHGCCQGSIGEGGADPYPAYVAVSWDTPDAEAAIEQFGSLCAEGANHGTLYPRPDYLGRLSPAEE